MPSQSTDCDPLSSSPRRLPTDLTGLIIEDDETESESPNEPITPVSGRQSRDLGAVAHDLPQTGAHNFHDIVSSHIPEQPDVPIAQLSKESLSQLPPPAGTTATLHSSPDSHGTQVEAASQLETSQTTTTPASRKRESVERRISALSQSRSFLSKMIRRTSSNGLTDNSAVPVEFKQPTYNGATATNGSAQGKKTPSRKTSWRPSFTTTRSNTPPSPESVLGGNAARPTIPESGDFFENKKKTRASTINLSQMILGRGRAVAFATNNKKDKPRRARSLERKKHDEPDLARAPWAIPPDAGTGMKARRLSVSLPDDFNVDVVELFDEFEYQNKLLGRHGKHLGKGAASKVTLMGRKGAPGELYAVKEFRSKSNSETVQEYEKKIKSEYSIAKSLHHPNIVETTRLCTHHGRWSHVMEYCSEGDLYGLVTKKYLLDESREVDRLCLFKQLVQGINYLHSNGIAHRDIKLENLLITKDSKLKITDFGVSEVFSGIHPGLREAGGQCGQGMGDIRLCKPAICGSLPYIAPEVLSKEGDYDPRPLDVWSSAVVMIYLTFGANLWEKAKPGLSTGSQAIYNELVRAWEKYNAKKATNPELPNDVIPKVGAFDFGFRSLALRRLLLNMLNPDPEKRITIAEVISSRWMKNVECCQLQTYEDPVMLIDASKKSCIKGGPGKIYCHNHLPPQSSGSGLPPMPGKAGY